MNTPKTYLARVQTGFSDVTMARERIEGTLLHPSVDKNDANGVAVLASAAQRERRCAQALGDDGKQVLPRISRRQLDVDTTRTHPDLSADLQELDPQRRGLGPGQLGPGESEST